MASNSKLDGWIVSNLIDNSNDNDQSGTNYSDNESIDTIIDSDDDSSFNKIQLPEDTDDELKKIMSTADNEITKLIKNVDFDANSNPCSSSKANETENVQTENTTNFVKPAPIVQRRRSERLANKHNDDEITTRRGRRGGRKKSKEQQTNPQSSSSVAVTENESNSNSVSKTKLNGEKRKRCHKNGPKSNLSMSILKYFIEIEENPLAANDIDSNDNDSELNAESNSNKKEIGNIMSAKCSICGERKQYQKGSTWNLKSHLEKVRLKFNFHPSSNSFFNYNRVI